MANSSFPLSASSPKASKLVFTNLALTLAFSGALGCGCSALQAQGISFASAQSTLATGFSQSTGLPNGVAVDQAGDVFIAASGSGQVFEIPAGGGAPISLGSGFGTPSGVAVDVAGDVYVADPGYPGGAAVIEIPTGGKPPQAVTVNGLITPVAVALDGQGDLFILDAGNPGAGNAGVLELPAAQLPAGGAPNPVGSGVLSLVTPAGIAIDSGGDVFIADSGQTSIVELLANGTPSSVGSGLGAPMGVAVDAAGDVFIANRTATVVEVSATGTQTTVPFSGQAGSALGVGVDGKGNLFVADTGSDGQVLELATAASVNFGTVNVTASSTLTLNYAINSTVSFGSVSIATQGAANLDFSSGGASTCTGSPSGICSVAVSFAPVAPGVRLGAVQLFDTSSPASLLSETLMHGIGVAPQIAFSSAPQTTLASGGSGTNYVGVALDAAGDVFYTQASATSVLELQAPGSTPTTVGSGLSNPNGVVVDGAGNLFVASGGSSSILELLQGSGTQTSVGTGLSEATGVAVDVAGDVFVADTSLTSVMEVPAGGGTQAQIGSGLASPNGVAVDGSGDVFIADTANARVLEVPAGGGSPSTVGSGFFTPTGIAVDAAGDVFVADPGLGYVEEVPAGGGAQSQIGIGLARPSGVAVDAAGDVFITTSNQVVEVQGSQAPTVNFSAVPIMTTSTPQIVTVQNVGNAPLGFSSISVAGTGFATDAGTTTCTTPLNPGGSCNVGVVCSASATVTNQGTLTITDNALNAAAAGQVVSLSCTGVLQPQTISFTPPPPASAMYNTQFQLTATGGGSGNPVVLSNAGVCTLSGTTYTMTSGTGTCSVIASQAGDATHAAAQVTLTVTAVLATNTVTFNISPPATAAYASSFTVSAVGGGSTNPVIYESSDECHNVGNIYTMVNGIGECYVTAFQFGDGNYANGSVTVTTLATLAPQTIVFTTPAPGSAVYNANFSVAATGGASQNPITYSSSGACINIGPSYSMTSGTGTCQVIANQAGRVFGGTYEYAPATQVTEVVNATLASQTVSFTTNAPASKPYGGAFTVAAKSSFGLAITYSSSGSCTNSGATFTMTSGSGTCSVIASQPGNNNYAAASMTEFTTATKVSQTITFSTNPPSTAVYPTSFAVVATASSGLAVVFTSSGSCSNSGATYTMTSGTGTCSVIANQPGNGNYNAATQVSKSTTAQKAAATVSINNIPANAAVGGSFSPTYTTNSNGATSVTSSTSTTCTVSGNTVTYKAAGTCTVVAHTASTTNYNAGTGASQSFTIIKPTLTSISPTSGTHGTTVAVTLTGTNLTGATAISVSGTGLTVNGFSVTGSTTVKGNFVIASNATLTARTVSVTTPIGTTNTVTFTVK